MSRSVFISRLITAILMLVIGIIVRVDTSNLPFGSLKRIQSGFFPTVFGNLMIVLSLLMLITLIMQYVKKQVNKPEEDENPTHSLKGFALFLGIMIGFLVINYLVGFVIAVFFALIASGYALGLKGWRLLALGVITTVLIWLVFDVWLMLYLPTGLIFS